MSASRRALLASAFSGISKDGSAVSLGQLKAAYLFKNHPNFLSGGAGKEETLQLFLRDFDADAHKSDGKVS